MTFRLHPAPPRPPVQQCDEPYDDSNDNEHYKISRRASVSRNGRDPDKCRNPAVYKLGTKCYCTPHAGRRLIAWIEDGTIVLPENLP